MVLLNHYYQYTIHLNGYYYITYERLYCNGFNFEKKDSNERKKFQYYWKKENSILENLFTRIAIRYTYLICNYIFKT